MARQKTVWKTSYNKNGYQYMKRYADLAATLKVLDEKDLSKTDTLTEMNDISNMFMEALLQTFKINGEPLQDIINLEESDTVYSRE